MARSSARNEAAPVPPPQQFAGAQMGSCANPSPPPHLFPAGPTSSSANPSTSPHAAPTSSSSNHSLNQCLWDWEAREHTEEPSSDANQDVAKFVWDCLNRDDDEDELLGLLGNQTPLRDCCAFFDIGDITCKETLDLEESRESKRRRVLEYPSESSQPEAGDHEMGSNFATSEIAENSLLCTDEPQSLNWDMQHNGNNFGKISPLSNGTSYNPSDSPLETYSDGNTMYFTPEQMPSTQESVTYIDCESDVPGTSEIVPVTENFIMQEARKLSTLKVSKVFWFFADKAVELMRVSTRSSDEPSAMFSDYEGNYEEDGQQDAYDN